MNNKFNLLLVASLLWCTLTYGQSQPIQPTHVNDLIDLYLPTHANKDVPVLLSIPGGGYRFVSMKNEGVAVAQYFCPVAPLCLAPCSVMPLSISTKKNGTTVHVTDDILYPIYPLHVGHYFSIIRRDKFTIEGTI